MASKQKYVSSLNKEDTENVVHLSTFYQMVVADDFKNVLKDYVHQNCPKAHTKKFPYASLFAQRLEQELVVCLAAENQLRSAKTKKQQNI